MPDIDDVTRLVKIISPADEGQEAEVVLESVPVYFDLGWKKVDGEDYGNFADYPVAGDTAAPATTPSTRVTSFSTDPTV